MLLQPHFYIAAAVLAIVEAAMVVSLLLHI